MKKMILISSALIIAAAIFTACSASDNSDDGRKKRGQQEVLSRENEIEDSPAPSASPDGALFLVRLENNALTLYEVKEPEPCVIKSVNIDTSYYPFEDIRELNAGIPAYSKESGYEILENFTN